VSAVQTLHVAQAGIVGMDHAQTHRDACEGDLMTDALARANADHLLDVLNGQLLVQDLNAVEEARTQLMVALMSLIGDPSYADIHAQSSVLLDTLAEMLEDPALSLTW
jgi:hypothetical protein